MRAAVLLALAAVAVADPLGPYNVDPNLLTVGGLSSGAFMAIQMHVAFSSQIKGASVFAGGPFYCAEGQETTALTTCMNALVGSPNAQALAALTNVFAATGSVDPVANLASAKVFVYSGILDSVVSRSVVTSAQQYYQLFLDPSKGGNMTEEYNVFSEHTFPTLNYGNSCPTLGEPYISNCNYDGAGQSLKQLYGYNLNPRTTQVSANLMMFDQTKFGTGNSLNTVGFIYVPTSCQKGAKCGLHMNFHGCQQTTADIQAQYAQDIGLNEWAESNNIIVVYPQAVKSYFMPTNPEGCWDWWGYTNGNYAFKTGPQMSFAMSIIQYIMGKSA